ncbi:MAG: aspartate--tRNA ligase [Clostridia bacterium]|nr:aspartate--tRNA ligase [Clostridia bacterium]
MSEILRRTSMCGDLRISDVNKEVTLNGWVAKQRNLGSLIFIDLRDKTGICQVVFDDNTPKELFELAAKLRTEYTVGIKGVVRERSSKNTDIPTGEVEIVANKLVLYSEAETPPIYIKDDDNVDEMLRLKYRYLDLRKTKMQRNLTFRHKVTTLTRNYFDSCGFTEVETPILISSTPEGARDYLVPSRVHKGEFYALPQSPQLFKQLLMIGGTDRYMQIAKCFRDEDLRADRQPEFTQIDLEMSFVNQDMVIEILEGYLKKLFNDLMGIQIQTPIMRMTWDEAMERYGSDKPDLRFGFELKKLNDTVKNCNFKVFTDCLANKGDVRGICVTGGSDFFSRKDIDKLTEMTRDYGAKGLVWIRFNADGVTSSVNKFFTQEELCEIGKVFDAKTGDIVFIVSDKAKVTYDSLGFLRRECAKRMGLLNDKEYKLLWVVDFPMFEESEEDGSLKAMHHPFTCPKLDQLNLLDVDPLLVRADAYDIVLNGVELGGGSVRIHDKNIQAKMFEILGLTKEQCEERFGFLIEALKYGTPPHAGLALGLDRLVMLLLGEPTIKEVIAFPKNQNAECLVSCAPSVVETVQLDELGIKVK